MAFSRRKRKDPEALEVEVLQLWQQRDTAIDYLRLQGRTRRSAERFYDEVVQLRGETT